MADFAALATLAKRLIDENGRQISVVRLASTPADAAKPWRGPADARSPALKTVPGIAAFVPLGSSGLGIEFSEEVPDAQVCLFPAADDAGERLEDFDEIIDGAGRWSILETQVLQPGATRLLYFFQVQQ